uniref:Nucleoside diphosphate kinase-like domain-containing protein n=1 Tax=Podarcis muralis TaxID=64176 RepID=A0A670I2N5_PODMU
ISSPLAKPICLLLGDDAICPRKNLIGPANSAEAHTDAPNSVRAYSGTDGIRNVACGPDSFASAARELGLFFPFSGSCWPRLCGPSDPEIVHFLYPSTFCATVRTRSKMLFTVQICQRFVFWRDAGDGLLSY